MHIAYQPIWDLSQGIVFGYEALLRPVQGSPQDFICRARKEGSVVKLDRWIMEQASLEASKYLAAHERLFLNVEPETATALSVWSLRTLALPPHQIVIEITERGALDGLELGLLRSSGVSVALDDFGTGNSNLSALSLGPDFVKVDRRFLAEPHERGVLKMLARSAAELGFALIAEGVEKENDLAFVEKQSIRYAQGYFLGRPAAAKTICPAKTYARWIPP